MSFSQAFNRRSVNRRLMCCDSKKKIVVNLFGETRARYRTILVSLIRLSLGFVNSTNGGATSRSLDNRG